MGCEAGPCKTSTPLGIFIVTPSIEGWPTKAKETPSPHEVTLALLDTNPVFQSLGAACSKQAGAAFQFIKLLFVIRKMHDQKKPKAAF